MLLLEFNPFFSVGYAEKTEDGIRYYVSNYIVPSHDPQYGDPKELSEEERELFYYHFN